MIDKNDELKYTICDVCGHEKKCFVQYEFDEDFIACPDCLFTEDRDY